LVSSEKHTTCPWKGVASYYNVLVDGKENKDSAWYYPQPSAAARQLRDHVSFWRGVEVVADDREPGDSSSSAPLLGRLLAGLRRAA